MFEELTVCVFNNIRKQPFFTVDERVALLKEATVHLSNVKVASFSGLLPDYMHSTGATVIVRGLRSVTDFEYEQREAQIIHHIAPRAVRAGSENYAGIVKQTDCVCPVCRV